MLKTDTLINFRSQRSLTKMAHKLPQGIGERLKIGDVVPLQQQDCWFFSSQLLSDCLGFHTWHSWALFLLPASLTCVQQ